MSANFLTALSVPPSDRPATVRPAGRVVLLDRAGSVLMVEAVDDRGSLWFTPGGAIEVGEDVATATIREVAEETDIDLAALGPVVLRRVARLEFLGDWIEAHETFHVVRLDARPETRGRNLDVYERDVIRARRWLSPDELRADGMRVYPRCLPRLVDAVASGAVRSPWEELDVDADPAKVVVHRG